MSYAEQSLVPGEEIVLKAKLHWGLFIIPIIFFLFSCLFMPAMANDDTGIFVCGAFFLFLMAVAGAAQVGVNYFTTEFAVTNKRIIAKRGFLRRRSLEIQLSKVESISVKQPIMGRILNYGTIAVTGSGGTQETFPGIANPMEFRKQINAQITTNF
ncbi:MAG: PH domain-containing protein [Anaerolineales bacterium]|nr:PH domain-containing protein [Anaerolineales bacterium]